ncbi:MAG TPA: hypothetical protein VKV74_15475 [Bryobacteraceae bacterium]|nr:hypothetical protein [Bryobacteraceae bacterium]
MSNAAARKPRVLFYSTSAAPCFAAPVPITARPRHSPALLLADLRALSLENLFG